MLCELLRDADDFDNLGDFDAGSALAWVFKAGSLVWDADREEGADADADPDAEEDPLFLWVTCSLSLLKKRWCPSSSFFAAALLLVSLSLFRSGMDVVHKRRR